MPAGLRGRAILGKGNDMEELIKRLERVIQIGASDKDGMHPISAETVLEVVKELSEHGTNLASLGTDCISRQAAIDAVNCITVMKGIRSGKSVTAEAVDCAKRIIVDNIRQLPPIQPKRGKWIDKGITGDWQYQIDGRGRSWHEWQCDQCKDMVKKRSFYCPNCGADMRGEQNEAN